jgi:putative hemolysin
MRRPVLITVVVALVIMAVCTVAQVFLNHQVEAEHRKQCDQLGGTLSTHNSYRSSSSYFCISPDGKLLKVW